MAPKLKVGITFIGYECSELMLRALNPWIQIRKSGGIEQIESLKIGLSHGCFEETAQLGFPILSQDGSQDIMSSLYENGEVDSFILYKDSMKEYDMWTGNYLRFKDDIDLLVMLNHDEMWELDEIKKLFGFITNCQPFVDYYKINFKNYCINERTWVNDFIVPRMWWVNRHGGLKGFYKDELVEYNDGSRDYQRPFAVLPQPFLFPKHFSWVGSKEYLQRKLHFQALRFGSCSYSWDTKNDCLQLNEEFYAKFNVPKPILNQD